MLNAKRSRYAVGEANDYVAGAHGYLGIDVAVTGSIALVINRGLFPAAFSEWSRPAVPRLRRGSIAGGFVTAVLGRESRFRYILTNLEPVVVVR